ncbi:MAG: IclR family transcriptional regulator [Sphaerochaetaceae bacterium]|jgi:DNA-binding IclR family transcriptional regulator|nr:IclR family transcriptional regulator [Sphaerochaetaceae bacterium]
MSNKVEGTFKLLEVFCKNNYPLGVTTLSNMLLEGKSSIFQKLKILEELEYIEKEEHSDKYILTTKLLELMNESMSSYYKRTNIHKYVRQVADQTGECTYFGLRNKKNRIVYVDRYASENALSVYTNIGDSPLPHCTAHGKVLLAYLAIEEIEEIVKDGLQKFTDKTLVTKEALFNEIRKIREQGYAFDDEERMVGVRCIAAPVFNSHQEMIGAIGISGIYQNLPDDKMLKHAKSIMAVANHMTNIIGNDLVY